MSVFGYFVSAGRAIASGMHDPDHVSGSLKVGAGGAARGLTAVAAGIVAAPLLPIAAAGAGAAMLARAITKANE